MLDSLGITRRIVSKMIKPKLTFQSDTRAYIKMDEVGEENS